MSQGSSRGRPQYPISRSSEIGEDCSTYHPEILLAHIVLGFHRVLPHFCVQKDITMQAQESATVTLAGGQGAICLNHHGHHVTIAQKPFGKEVCTGHL